jgi:nuclear GTP-binding protein
LPSGPDISIHPKGKGKIKVPADDGLGVDSVVAYLGEKARAKNDGKPLAVAVLGLTNVGFTLFSHNSNSN